MLAQPADGGRDPGGVRRPRAAVRRRLRGDPGRAPLVPRPSPPPGRGTLERERAGAHPRSGSCAAGVLWIAGALAEGAARTVLWLVALAIDYGAPLVTLLGAGPAARSPPRRGRSRRRTSPSASSCSSSSRSARRSSSPARRRPSSSSTPRARGRVRARLPVAPPRCGGSTSTTSRAIAERRLELAANRTLLARDAYTYLHVVLVAGHHRRGGRRRARDRPPDRRAPRRGAASVVGGPALYLLAHVAVPAAHDRADQRAGACAARSRCVAIGLLGAPRPRSSSRRCCWPSSSR